MRKKKYMYAYTRAHIPVSIYIWERIAFKDDRSKRRNYINILICTFHLQLHGILKV
jgi:hypothetical protein